MGVVNRILCKTMAVALLAMTIAPSVGGVVYAKDNTVHIEGKQYELEKKSKYAYLSGVTPTTISSNGSQFGEFSITGNLSSVAEENGYTAYEVTSGLATLSYNPVGEVISATDMEWHIIEDKTREVNGEKLTGKILKGAVILQTSNDGSNWITDASFTNIAGDGTEYKTDFYETKEIQLINGCFYRVIVAYEAERKIDKQNWHSSDREQKKYVEIYEFYLKDATDAIIDAGAHPDTKMVVGDMTYVTNTGKDNGFSGQNAITSKDPHYAWSLGEFELKGFTDTSDYQGEKYFLKTLGDVITLTFKLQQNINCLHDNTSLSISSDKNGSDQYFMIKKTDFKHGALIVRYTDSQGRKSDPIIYTDFLAAYARTGADTRVQFFEEGDYEVALDYEIKDSSGIDSYYNYRMFFTFKIRNGTNMVYIFDNESKSELSDSDWTESGFTINTANSHYLKVTVERIAIVDAEGGKKQDPRWKKRASDGDSYTEDGIYIVTATNEYDPNGDFSRTVYVGNDPYIRAIPKTGKSLDKIVELIRYTDYDMQHYLDAMDRAGRPLDEIVSLVNQGYEITDTGELIAPTESESDQVSIRELDDTDDETERVKMTDGIKEVTVEETEEISEISEDQTKTAVETEKIAEPEAEKKKTSPVPIIVLFAIGVATVCIYATGKGKRVQQGIASSSSAISDEKVGES